MQKDAIERNEYLPLPNLKIYNGKFQAHKNFLQSICIGESSKISNVVIYIGKEENQPFIRHIPLVVNQCQAAELSATSKAKQLGLWSPEVFVSFAEND